MRCNKERYVQRIMPKNCSMLRLSTAIVLLAFSIDACALVLTFNPSDQGHISKSKDGTLSDVTQTNDLLVGRLDESLVSSSEMVESIGIYKFDLRPLPEGSVIESASLSLNFDTTRSHPFNGDLDEAYVGVMWGIDPYNPPEVVQTDFSQNGGVYIAWNFSPASPVTRSFAIENAVDQVLAQADSNGFLRVVIAPNWSSNLSYGAAMGGMYVTSAAIEINYTNSPGYQIPAPATLALICIGLAGIRLTRRHPIARDSLSRIAASTVSPLIPELSKTSLRND